LTDSQDQWLSLGEAAKLLGVHPSTLRIWADRDEIPSQRTAGGHRRFLRADIDRQIQRQPPPMTAELQLLIQNAVGRTRMELSEGRLEATQWHQKLDDDQRHKFQSESRNLMRKMIQSISEGGVSQNLAGELGEEYYLLGVEANFTLADSVEAFLFFREFLMDSVFSLFETMGGSNYDDWHLLRSHIASFTNAVLINLVRRYDLV
jgi:excisionase family DNA binding protein